MSTHLLDLRHDLVGVPGGRRLHAPREAERARLHLARNAADAALVDGVAEMMWESAIRGDPLRAATVTGQVLLAELVIVV